MKLNMPFTPNPPRRAAPAPAKDLATVYTRGGQTLRVPLRPAPVGAAGCAGHPELQLMRWLRNRAAAEPGFPVRVRSVLLVVQRGGCPACQEALSRFLRRFRLTTKLRLVRTGGHPTGCSCGCSHCQASGKASKSVLDELLGEAFLEVEREQLEREQEEEYRKFNRQFRRNMAQTIANDGKHPLGFLIKDGKGGKPVWRSAKDRRVDAGHVTPVLTLSRRKHLTERLAIQDRHLNRSDGARMGATGKGSTIQVIDIKGVPVDVATARKWNAQKLLPDYYVTPAYIAAHRVKGWSANGELFFAVGSQKDLVSETGF
ncbi:polymorphic toxin type 5 domain-containing protein [Hymenobacter sp. YC55]|uniref:polymorphic toxin type 5 domain-containing protein n=1 Tax=Hymenobacter sp. YC55 TaxID=3034019 RepID=UPI0023F69D23|nr:polymorphic toxin type 5 domain-containing protein [Hymenobacter sp. YC55]MDF7811296.1 polymorphic toxin type 5 domain-containing protein [Hymenobacter sp. YC55]